VAQKNQANTRIFTFGVGDDVNASLLDQLADQTRAVSTYVRPAEDIEVKASSLYAKISHPVLANLRLTTSDNIRLEEVYPPNLPDLFHGGQLVVLGRYTGQGAGSIKLSGVMGKETRDFVYETTFQAKTNEDRDFVEHIWARRKVGFLLDQIRLNGESKELMTELMSLARKYGIATPYTSHLIVPDAAMPVAGPPRNVGGRVVSGPMGGGGFGGFGPGMGGPGIPGGGFGGGGLGGFGGGIAGTPGGLAPAGTAAKPKTVAEFARENQSKPGDAASKRGGYEDDRLKKEAEALAKGGADKDVNLRRVMDGINQARDQKAALDEAKKQFDGRQYRNTQAGKLGVDLSVANNSLRNQERMAACANVTCNGRQCIELGGVWIDEGYEPNMKCVTVKAQSDAYFRILEKNPKMKDVFRLGNYLVWVAPSKTALIIDTSDGKDKLTDAEIDDLFAVKK
jgi:Ca-activated chloride channel homolog